MPQPRVRRTSWINSWKTSAPLTSTPCAGSSSTRRSGRSIKARASSSRWNSPPESVVMGGIAEPLKADGGECGLDLPARGSAGSTS